jgi:hypothetical protein
VGSAIVVAYDAAPVLEAPEHGFDPVALAKGTLVCRIPVLAAFRRRDAGLHALLGEGGANPSAPGAVRHDVAHQVAHIVLQISDDVLDDVSDRDHAHDLARV